MQSRMIVGVVLFVGLFGGGVLASRTVAGDRQWSIVNFKDPVIVQGNYIMGPVLIVHDDQKMARGEACTTFYRFDPRRGPREALVSFHCLPVQRQVASGHVFSYVDTGDGCKRLVEYQIAGDSEAHGVPK